ncbi:MAG: tetratricopeptide repeat protein [Bacteroidota bacterium]
MSRFRPILLLLLLGHSSFAGQHASDSLRAVIASGVNDSVRMAAYNTLFYNHIHRPDSALMIISEFRQYIGTIKNERYYALALRKAGAFYHRLNFYDKALELYIRSAEVFDRIGDKEGLANCYNNMGNSYTSKGELTNDKLNFERAIEYHNKAISLRLAIGDSAQLKNSFNNIGLCYLAKGDYEVALDYFQKAFRLYMSTDKDANGIDMISLNLGDTYLEMGKKYRKAEYFGKALEYFMGRLKAYQSFSSNERKATALARVGEIYMETGDFARAEEYLMKSYTMALELKNQGSISESAQYLSRLYEQKGDYGKSLRFLKEFNAAKDSLLNLKNRSNVEQMQALFESSKKDREIEKRNEEIRLKNAEVSRQRVVIFSAIGGLALLVGIALLLYNRNAIRKKANAELTAAYSKIELKNRQITDSINYAKRIQEAILPPAGQVRKRLDGFFVFFRPRDIVSGDFYWFTSHKGKIIIAVADCTGHGVPGALMSMIGNTMLNEIVNQKDVLDPGSILTRLNSGVIDALHQHQGDLLTQDDGMDIALCVMDETQKNSEEQEVLFASANLSLYLVEQGKVKEVRGDINSIGGSMSSREHRFSVSRLSVRKGTALFMSTDGFYDQFGGDNDTKYLTTNFEKLIARVDMGGEPAAQLEKEFDSWKGGGKQIDDVLVAGFRV